MEWLHYLAYFGGGAFLTNAIPHFVSGVMGRPFQSPFAKPRGEGLSSSTVNVLWGFFNLAVGYLLVCRVGDFDLRATDDAIALGLGILLFGLVTGAVVRPVPRRQLPRSGVSGHLKGTFRSLEGYNYRIWAVGALVSNIGSWMQRTAQDWIVLTELTAPQRDRDGNRDGVAVRPANPAAAADRLAADHLDRRKVLFCTQAAMGLLALGLGLLVVTGLVQLWHVYFFAFLLGCAAAFDSPARQTFVAELVEERYLPNAVALNSTSFNAARMIGPAIAGGLIAGVGSGWVFLINAALLCRRALLAGLAASHELKPSHRAVSTRGSFVEGFRYVLRRPDLRVDPVHAVPGRHLRTELPDLHLDHVGHRLSRRRRASTAC